MVVWIVHDGTLEGIVGVFLNEKLANKICDDFNSDRPETYFVDTHTVFDKEGL